MQPCNLDFYKTLKINEIQNKLLVANVDCSCLPNGTLQYIHSVFLFKWLKNGSEPMNFDAPEEDKATETELDGHGGPDTYES